jgi:hypothetical protein
MAQSRVSKAQPSCGDAKLDHWSWPRKNSSRIFADQSQAAKSSMIPRRWERQTRALMLVSPRDGYWRQELFAGRDLLLFGMMFRL